MRSSRRVLPWLLLVLVPACSVTVQPGDAEAPGDAADVTDAVDAADTRPPVACGARTSERLQLMVRTSDGASYGCAVPLRPGEQTRTLDRVGALRVVDAETLELDSCPPRLDCTAPRTTTITVRAPGLSLQGIPGSTLARVRVAVEYPWGCHQRVTITSVASWEGETNPMGHGDGLVYLAGADGSTQVAGDVFAVERVALGCAVDAGRPCGGEPADDFALRFTAPAGAAAPVTLAMGTTTAWTLRGQELGVRNLRSFVTGYCDDYWNWGYWVVPLVRR